MVLVVSSVTSSPQAVRLGRVAVAPGFAAIECSLGWVKMGAHRPVPDNNRLQNSSHNPVRSPPIAGAVGLVAAAPDFAAIRCSGAWVRIDAHQPDPAPITWSGRGL